MKRKIKQQETLISKVTASFLGPNLLKKSFLGPKRNPSYLDQLISEHFNLRQAHKNTNTQLQRKEYFNSVYLIGSGHLYFLLHWVV